MELTEKEAFEFHYRLWAFLVKNPRAAKLDWEGWTELGEDVCVLDFCFLCEYYRNIAPTGVNRCVECILSEALGSNCFEKCSVFQKWTEATNDAAKRKYATIIRDVVIKKKEV